MGLFVDAVLIDDVAVGVDAAGAGRLIERAAAGAKTVLIVIVGPLTFVALYLGHHIRLLSIALIIPHLRPLDKKFHLRYTHE